MDIARDICTDSFYIVNSGLPRIPVTAVGIYRALRPKSAIPHLITIQNMSPDRK